MSVALGCQLSPTTSHVFFVYHLSSHSIAQMFLSNREWNTRQALLVGGNAMMTLGWARVLIELVSLHAASSLDGESCINKLYPCLWRALAFSSIEFFHCISGLTRSNPAFVLMFLVVRSGVEYFAGPSVSSATAGNDCMHWTHLYTLTCWSVGEVVRFGCFTLAEMSSSKLPKSVRYIVGPIAFPLGALGEMFMVKRLAENSEHHKVWIWIVVALWPLGFAPLMAQLLRQRKKHFAAVPKTKKEQ